MKQTTLALAIMTALALTACGESAEEKQARLFKEQQAQIQQLQAQQVQQAQIQQQQQFQQPQQYAPQPQVIQQPAAPVIVQAPHQDNTLTNLATGALIGHALSGGFNGGSNSAPAERIVEHKTVIVNNHPAPAAPTTSFAPPPALVAQAPAPAAPVSPRASGMDMNKLSQSAKYAPPSAASAPAPRSTMSMSKLSSYGKR
jgi:hypothetical protein